MTTTTVTSISRDALRDLLASERQPVLLEALGERYWRDGHLPGAVQFPHEPALVRAAAASIPDRDRTVVVYCASETCRNSHVAAAVLADLGYEDVRVYPGGKADWTAAGLPIERG